MLLSVFQGIALILQNLKGKKIGLSAYILPLDFLLEKKIAEFELEKYQKLNC